MRRERKSQDEMGEVEARRRERNPVSRLLSS